METCQENAVLAKGPFDEAVRVTTRLEPDILKSQQVKIANEKSEIRRLAGSNSRAGGMIRFASAIAAVIAVSGCAGGPSIRTDFDPAANFSSYHTYELVGQGSSSVMNPLLSERVRVAIERNLGARSFTRSTTPDFAVSFTLGARDRVQVTEMGAYQPYYPGYGRAYRYGWAHNYTSTEIRTITEGSLVIDIYDARTRKPVWQGRATQSISPGSVDEADIDRAVAAALAKFPPSAK